MLLLLKNLPAFIIQPLTKNLYRSSEQVKSKISLWFMLAGIVISTVGVPMVGSICFWGFGLFFSWTFYLIAMAYVFPQFLCSMEFLRLFQQKRVNTVLIGLGLEIFIHLLCNLILIQTFGIEIVLFSAALGQWTLYFYLMHDKKREFVLSKC